MTEDDRLTDKDLIWHPGTGVISAAQLMAMHTRHANAIRPIPSGTVLGYEHLMADADRGALLAELNRATEEAARLERENERLNLEVVQVQSGAQIAMNAGVTALQEVKRLEGVVAGLKEINDRMAEDRLRLTALVEAQRVALSSRGAPVPECPDEWCLGWKDSGICPAGLKHW